FFNAIQMRRRVQTSAITRGLEHRRDHGRRRPFALRAGNVNRLDSLLRIAKQLHQPSHAIELELSRAIGHARRPLVIDPAEVEVEGKVGRWSGGCGHIPIGEVIRSMYRPKSQTAGGTPASRRAKDDEPRKEKGPLGERDLRAALSRRERMAVMRNATLPNHGPQSVV